MIIIIPGKDIKVISRSSVKVNIINSSLNTEINIDLTLVYFYYIPCIWGFKITTSLIRKSVNIEKSLKVMKN